MVKPATYSTRLPLGDDKKDLKLKCGLMHVGVGSRLGAATEMKILNEKFETFQTINASKKSKSLKSVEF